MKPPLPVHAQGRQSRARNAWKFPARRLFKFLEIQGILLPLWVALLGASAVSILREPCIPFSALVALAFTPLIFARARWAWEVSRRL